jgi:hypothetical protein
MPSKKKSVKRNTAEKPIDSKSMITFDSVKNFQTLFVNSFIDYSYDLINKYKFIIENDEYISNCRNSWIVNFKTIFCPTWADLDLENHPEVDTKENLVRFFYRIPTTELNPIPFDSYQMVKESDHVDESYFTALFLNTYSDECNALTGCEKRAYDRLSFYIPIMRNFFKYNNETKFNDFRKKMYHCALLMRVNNDSSVKMNRGILEECKYTYSMIRMIRSIDLFFKMKYQEAYAYVDLSNLRDYINNVLLPLSALIRAYTFLDNEGDLVEFSSSDFYRTPNSIHNPDWLVASQEDYEEYLEELRKRNEEVAQHQREMEMKREIELKRRAQEDAELDRIMRNRVSTPPPVNQAFVERLDRDKAAEEAEIQQREKAQQKVVVYKSESEIPNILRRRESNPSKEGETLLLFFYGSTESMVYTKRVLKTKIKGEMKVYSVQKLVSELPGLLRNERNKANFMRSSNIFFGRKVTEMNNFYRNQLYETLISFCEEIASTSLEDNDLRLSILQNYYGKKKESESLEQYFYNFRFDIFNSVGMYYCFYSSV